jgi:hypothetical protein
VRVGDELDSVAPGQSLSMEIRTFVDLDDIDPISLLGGGQTAGSGGPRWAGILPIQM